MRVAFELTWLRERQACRRRVDAEERRVGGRSDLSFTFHMGYGETAHMKFAHAGKRKEVREARGVHAWELSPCLMHRLFNIKLMSPQAKLAITGKTGI
jgi:hypothetical protein